jgi:hypothetical protein
MGTILSLQHIHSIEDVEIPKLTCIWCFWLLDSSATDTDPEEEANRLSQQQQGEVDLTGAKKLKTKKQRNKSGNNNSNNGSKPPDIKPRKNNKKERRDIKKEKENKDANKKNQRVSSVMYNGDFISSL